MYVWLGDGYSLERTIREYFATCVDQMLAALYEDDAQEHRPGRKCPLVDSLRRALQRSIQRRAQGAARVAQRRGSGRFAIDAGPACRPRCEAGRFLSEQEVLQIWRRELAGDWSRAKQFAGDCPEAQHRRRRPERSRAYRSPLHGHSRGFPARCRVSVQRASCALGCPAHVVSVARVLHCGKRADEARTPGRRARAGARRQLATFSAAEGLALRSSMKSRPSAILRTAALAAAITLAVFQPPVLATGEQGPPAFPHDSQLLEKLHDRKIQEIGSASEDRLSLAAVVQGFNITAARYAVRSSKFYRCRATCILERPTGPADAWIRQAPSVVARNRASHFGARRLRVKVGADDDAAT